MLRRTLIATGYLALAAVMVLATAGLVAYGQGIEYDFKTGRIIHTGLVIIQSEPSGARVVLNGKKLKKKTSYRQSFEEGKYDFELVKDGFRTWKKTLKVVSSEVTLAQYVLMVPNKPAVAPRDTKPQIVVQNISKDHRHLAYITGGTEPAVYTMDLNDGGKATRVYMPKVLTVGQPVETLLDVTWSDDASHLMVVTQTPTGPVHHLMAADGSGEANLTQQYGFNLSGLKFSAGNWRQLYWISPDGLRRLDVGSQSVSGVLADKVSQFLVAEDRVLYIQASTLNRTLWSIDGRGNKQELIQALPDSESYALSFATYRGQEQLAIVPSRTHIGTVYSGLYGSNPVAKTIAHDVNDATFSPDGHLVAFSSQGHITTYDIERSTLTGKLVSYEAGGLSNMTSLTWFDSYHLLENQNGRLILSEYDGANAVDLGTMQGQLPAYNTSDGQSIVTFRPGTTGVDIVQITIKP